MVEGDEEGVVVGFTREGRWGPNEFGRVFYNSVSVVVVVVVVVVNVYSSLQLYHEGGKH